MNKEKLLDLSEKDPKPFLLHIKYHKTVIEVQVRILPNVEGKIRILVTTSLKPSLHSALKKSKLDSWIQVKAKIWAGREYAQFPLHIIDQESGGVRFELDLVKCKDLRSCISRNVCVKIKASFITRSPYVNEEWVYVESSTPHL